MPDDESYATARMMRLFFLTNRENRMIEKVFRDGNGIFDEEAFAEGVRETRRRQVSIARGLSMATQFERVLYGVGLRIRTFSSVIFGKDLPQLVYEMYSGELAKRGIVTSTKEQVRRGASVLETRSGPTPLLSHKKG